ncbi:hypothetical protein ACJX0J_038822, partial [Zea mays]
STVVFFRCTLPHTPCMLAFMHEFSEGFDRRIEIWNTNVTSNCCVVRAYTISKEYGTGPCFLSYHKRNTVVLLNYLCFKSCTM